MGLAVPYFESCEGECSLVWRWRGSGVHCQSKLETTSAIANRQQLRSQWSYWSVSSLDACGEEQTLCRVGTLLDRSSSAEVVMP